MTRKKIKSEIPEEILNMFFSFIEQQSKTTKKYYDVDPNTNEKLQTREVTEERPTDLKSALSLFEKMYPQYFDKLTIERIKRLNKDNGDEASDKLEDMAREMFKVKD